MASDTATLDVEAIRAEARRQAGESPRIELGPEDRAPEGTGPIDTDPATRAHLIVQEVLAAAAKQDERPATPTIPVTVDSAAAAQARRIVEEVLAAAEQAAPTGRTDVEDEAPAVAPLRQRADLVLLDLEQPVVLLPGDSFPATPGAFAPPRRQSLDVLVTRALDSLEATPDTDGYSVDIDEMRASQDLREAIQKAASSEGMHPTRWIIAGLVWAVSFAVAVPVLLNGLVSSVDMTVDLWGDETVATQPADAEVSDVAAE